MSILRHFQALKKGLNMAQVAHLFQDAPHYRVPENRLFVKYSLRHFSNFFLERGLADAGDLALVSQLAEADTADAIVTQISVGTAAQLAAVVLTGGELSGWK